MQANIWRKCFFLKHKIHVIKTDASYLNVQLDTSAKWPQKLTYMNEAYM
jgi:hypothetical protein